MHIDLTATSVPAKPRRCSLWLVGTALLTASFLAQAEVAVVMSAKSAVEPLNKNQVSDIFMGKVTSFPSGGSAVPLDQMDTNAVREEFYTKVTGKSAAQVAAYWAKMSFTGKGTPPKEVANSAEIKKQLAANPNTIGYIEKSAVDESVKVLFIAP